MTFTYNNLIHLSYALDDRSRLFPEAGSLCQFLAEELKALADILHVHTGL